MVGVRVRVKLDKNSGGEPSAAYASLLNVVNISFNSDGHILSSPPQC